MKKKIADASKRTTKQTRDEFSEEGSESDDEKRLLSFSHYHFKEASIYEDSTKMDVENKTLFKAFPYNVYFKVENFLTDQHYMQQYDTITWLILLLFLTCSFSVTKWIHLNWGDRGILLLFLKAYSLLKQHGVFVLEYQQWSSYHKKCHYSKTLEENYAAIKIHPEDFPFVLQKMGMQLISNRRPTMSPGVNHAVTKGFNRNIAVFKKSGKELDFDINQVTLDNLESFIPLQEYLTISIPPVQSSV